MSFVSLSQPTSTLSLTAIEGAFTAIFVALSFAWPRLGLRSFTWIESRFCDLARRRNTSVVVVGLTALLIRLAILHNLPIPVPFGADDFSNLLAADTFTHGRLANPTPTMWVHFESIHVDMVPTYSTMYFPGQGLVLAAGKVLFGHPWFGVMVGGAVMCSALCWMLQAWLPAPWALLGGFLAVMRLALFSYWTSTYHNGGPIAAIGGALVLGSLPRFKKQARARHLALMCAGAGILGITRPYEGLLLCLPVLAALAYWLVRAKRPSMGTLLVRAIPGVALLAVAIGWLGYYDYRAFGSPLTLPYTVDRATYAVTPYFIWQKPHPEPHYRFEEMRRFYHIDEINSYNRVYNHPVGMSLDKIGQTVYFFAGLALLPPLFMLPWALRDRRIRFLVVCLLCLTAGTVIEIFLHAHYVAPFTAAFYAVGLQCLRHLYCWRPGDQPVGMMMTRSVVAICVLMVGLRVFNKQIGCPVPHYPVATWLLAWYGPDHYPSERSILEQRLEQLPGDQLAIVRYSATHDPLDEWVYNGADIDGSKVIWARAMDDGNDQDLLRYYRARKAWLIQPDSTSEEMTPYPVPGQVTEALSR